MPAAKPDLKIFAQDAKSGEIDTFPDILRGWGVTLDKTGGKPPLEWFNSIAKRTDEWLMYLTQRGVAEWDASLDYPQFAIVQHKGVLYISKKVTKGQSPEKSQETWGTLSEALSNPDMLSKTANLSDVANPEEARKNLGLGELATWDQAADVSNNFAARMGTSRVISGDLLPSSPGVWSVENSSWTPDAFGTLIYTTNRSDLKTTRGQDQFHHYIFLGHSGAVYVALSVNGDSSGWLGLYSSRNKPKASEVSGLVDAIYPVGICVFFAQNKNPNALFPGTTWKYIGEDRTIRTAKQNGDDVMQAGGTDSVTLNTSHLPGHAHDFWAKTSWFDYGTKTTNVNGKHAHNVGIDFGDRTSGDKGPLSVKTADRWTSENGEHDHTVNIGGHDHEVSGKTSYTGGGNSFSVVNKFVKLMGWYRSA